MSYEVITPGLLLEMGYHLDFIGVENDVYRNYDVNEVWICDEDDIAVKIQFPTKSCRGNIYVSNNNGRDLRMTFDKLTIGDLIKIMELI